jgi:hypothetical protein
MAESKGEEQLRTARSAYGDLSQSASGVSEQAGEAVRRQLAKLQTSLGSLPIAILREQMTALFEYADMAVVQAADGHAALSAAAGGLEAGLVHQALQLSQGVAGRFKNDTNLQQALALMHENMPLILDGLTALDQLVEKTLPAADTVDAGYDLIGSRSIEIFNKLSEYLGEPGSWNATSDPNL